MVFPSRHIGSPKMNFISTSILSKSNQTTEVDIFGSSKITVPKTSSNVSEGDKLIIGRNMMILNIDV